MSKRAAVLRSTRKKTGKRGQPDGEKSCFVNNSKKYIRGGICHSRRVEDWRPSL